MIKRLIFAAIMFALIFFMLNIAYAKKLFKEVEYQTCFCNEINGTAEYVLPDFTRVDCLTDTHAIEADFGSKWAEAIGQALYYSSMTGKQPGILLILEKESDKKYLDRIRYTNDCFNLGIDIWTITPKDLTDRK